MKHFAMTIGFLASSGNLNVGIGSELIAPIAVTQGHEASVAGFVVQPGKTRVSQADSRIDALVQAIRQDAIDQVRALVDQGVNVNAQDSKGLTPLMYAVERSNLQLVKTLFGAGAKINVKDKQGNTPLMSAALFSSSDIATYLLKKGADVNGESEKSQTALMFAAMRGDTRILKILLDKGASINKEDRDRFTALTYAVRAGHEKAAELLKAAGAFDPQPNLKDLPNDSSPMLVDRKPKLLNFPKPSYTQEARRNGIEGVVLVRVLVGADGTAKDAKALRRLEYGLTEMAIKAALKLKFEPAMKDGKPVHFWVSVQVEFNLRR